MFTNSHLFALVGARIVLAVALPQQYASASVPTACAVPLVLAVDGTKGPRTPTIIDPASPLNAIADGCLSLGYTVEHVEYPGGILAGVAGWTESNRATDRVVRSRRYSAAAAANFGRPANS
ncbi:hypothetical protein ACHMZP_32145 [Rhodococcus baikonurensis]|uniref:hypothetical protein n=1 Tax=Rhodococcus erythropolis group TaxID=2840174 RepID=UPI001179CA6B|nr:hypothetical protein [Rhodococcus erythropolis]PBI86900.1 hypothetical protein BKP42_63500 [Rhodococcus erythropolis]